MKIRSLFSSPLRARPNRMGASGSNGRPIDKELCGRAQFGHGNLLLLRKGGVKMAKRSIVFPEPKTLMGYATRAGLTLERLWKSIEAELAERPRVSEITIRGPKQTVTIKLKKDSRTLEKQVFADAKLGSRSCQNSDTTDE